MSDLHNEENFTKILKGKGYYYSKGSGRVDHIGDGVGLTNYGAYFFNHPSDYKLPGVPDSEKDIFELDKDRLEGSWFSELEEDSGWF